MQWPGQTLDLTLTLQLSRRLASPETPSSCHFLIVGLQIIWRLTMTALRLSIAEGTSADLYVCVLEAGGALQFGSSDCRHLA